MFESCIIEGGYSESCLSRADVFEQFSPVFHRGGHLVAALSLLWSFVVSILAEIVVLI